jgi:hypothetical protein
LVSEFNITTQADRIRDNSSQQSVTATLSTEISRTFSAVIITDSIATQITIVVRTGSGLVTADVVSTMVADADVIARAVIDLSSESQIDTVAQADKTLSADLYSTTAQVTDNDRIRDNQSDMASESVFYCKMGTDWFGEAALTTETTMTATLSQLVIAAEFTYVILPETRSYTVQEENRIYIIRG